MSTAETVFAVVIFIKFITTFIFGISNDLYFNELDIQQYTSNTKRKQICAQQHIHSESFAMHELCDLNVIVFHMPANNNLYHEMVTAFYSWYHESRFGFHFFFFFFHVAISDSVQWLPYLGFVPGPTRTTSKGLMSLLFIQKSYLRLLNYHYALQSLAYALLKLQQIQGIKHDQMQVHYMFRTNTTSKLSFAALKARC